MRAVVQDRYGDADVLRLGRVPVPTPEPNEVLVRVHAAGVDSGTWHVMTGTPSLARLAFGLRRPRNPVPGRDVAGTVVAVGGKVTRFREGDDVFGIGHGTFADYTAAPEAKLAHKPPALTFEQAAVVPVSALTALQGLRDAGRVRPGQQVLITGASGGVGSYAVQIAASMGAHVTATAGPTKTGLVAALGAEHVLDYTREDFADGTREYDVILDIAGSPKLSRLRRALTPTGTAVIAGGENSGTWTGMRRQLRAVALSPVIRQRLTMFISRENAADLEHLAALLADGTLTPAVDRTYPLSQAADAVRHLAAGRARGKVAIAVAGA